jgi:hypothetical protein
MKNSNADAECAELGEIRAFTGFLSSNFRWPEDADAADKAAETTDVLLSIDRLHGPREQISFYSSASGSFQ